MESFSSVNYWSYMAGQRNHFDEAYTCFLKLGVNILPKHLSSGYGRRLTCQRSWVRVPAPYPGWTFFTFICSKNCNVCLERQKTFLNANPKMAIFLSVIVLKRVSTTLRANLDFWWSFISITLFQYLAVSIRWFLSLMYTCRRSKYKICHKKSFLWNMLIWSHICYYIHIISSKYFIVHKFKSIKAPYTLEQVMFITDIERGEISLMCDHFKRFFVILPLSITVPLIQYFFLIKSANYCCYLCNHKKS